MDLCFCFTIVSNMELSLLYTEYFPLVYTNIHTHKYTHTMLYILVYTQ